MGSFDRVTHQTNRLLGYPADARLLIVNADDFGMYHAVNAAIIRSLQSGVVRSTTLMVPCPWALHAIHFLQANPEVAFGIHLTVIADWQDYRWGPVLPKDQVPSLVTDEGWFHNFEQMPVFLANVNMDELEMEFRAQIETVFNAGLQPTHLDWHSLRLNGNDAIPALMLKLAQEYGLALRVLGITWREKLQRSGLPVNDHDFLDSYLLDPDTKSATMERLLRDLPAGLSEWAVHPGIDDAESRAIHVESSYLRQTDFDFLVSERAKEIIDEEGIILMDYRALQKIWQAAKQ